MRAATSPSSGKHYGVALVCGFWRVGRATAYRRRPGPVGPMPDAELLARIHGVLAGGSELPASCADGVFES